VRAHGPEGKINRILGLVRPTIDRLPLRLYTNRDRLATWSLCILPNPGLRKRISEHNPDLIHIHWAGGGFLPVKDVRKLGKPIVWTLHDMWAFTGGCHLDKNCGRYKDSCGNCPQLGSQNSQDLSHWLLVRKHRSWLNAEMTIVCPSQWLAGEARSSRILKNKSISVIPNGVNLKQYRPIKRIIARTLFGFPPDETIILFGGMAATTDPNKGFLHVQEALKRLEALTSCKKIRLVVFGANKPAQSINAPAPINFIGRLHDDLSLALLYSSADVTLAPSLQENLGNIIIESMACGTPVVAFKIGGNIDIIDHKINGFLSYPYEDGSLAEGIAWIINDKIRWSKMSEMAREKCENKFDIEYVSKQYFELYSEILRRHDHLLQKRSQIG
jgi:glycosyltransferase involved in cell wall biosynthesis